MFIHGHWIVYPVNMGYVGGNLHVFWCGICMTIDIYIKFRWCSFLSSNWTDLRKYNYKAINQSNENTKINNIIERGVFLFDLVGVYLCFSSKKILPPPPTLKKKYE